VASKKRSGQLIAVLENHREVFCTVRFSECEPVEEDDDDQKLHARREVSSDGSSLSGSLLVASGDGSDDREDGADSVAAAAFAAAFATAFAAECEDDGDDDDDIGLAIAESSSTIDLDAHLTHEEVMFGVPEVDDFGAMVDRVVFDDVENGTTTTSSYRTPIESHDDAVMEEVSAGPMSMPAMCRLIDDLDSDSVSSSVGSLEQCIDTINTYLSSWTQESREYLYEIAKDIKEGQIIYWVQGLCANREKSLTLGERGLDGFDLANCPSANFSERVLKPVAASLGAKLVYCNIRDECIRKGDNCMCATHEEAERMAEVIGVFAKLAHQKETKFIFQNCGGKSIKMMLIPKIKKVESSAPTIAFVNEDSYHLSFYGYQCNRCFFTRELQEYRMYLDLQNIYEDLRKAAGDDPMPFTFDELLNWARPLVMVVDHHKKTPEEMEVLQNKWTAKGLVKIAPLH
jgi:hypothetical protein